MHYYFYRDVNERKFLIEYAKKNNHPIEKSEYVKRRITPKKLNALNSNDTIIIYDFSVLDDTAYKIIDKLLKKLFPKSISIIVVASNLTVSKFKCDGIPNLLNSIYSSEKLKIQKRLIKTRKTIEKSGGKIGRVSGKKTKSMFDNHKSTIFKFHNQKSTLKFILETIQKKDDKLIKATTQGLSAYIRKIKKIKSLQKEII